MGRVVLSAVVVTAASDRPADIVPEGGAASEPIRLRELYGHAVWRYDFTLPARRDASYRLGRRTFDVAADMTGDMRIAFVSCNGQEHGDEARSDADRNAMWRRLLDEHRERPFSLLLHGGDQLYADEAVLSHPDLKRWSEAKDEAGLDVPLTGEMREALRRYFFERYLGLLRQTAAATLYGRVPSMMIWDDHDIFDGWGSHRAPYQESPVAKGIFAVAREMFLLFQLGGTDEALPATVLDATGTSLGQAARFPGFSVILPDLRSERTPDRVMGDKGWAALEEAFALGDAGARRILVSSVPALGPRLSLLESLLDFWPGQQQYEDDLRDQWQSRAHRDEWLRLLRLAERQIVEEGGAVSVLSGEIHLATRGEMRCQNGRVLHQLVASGITHPKPSAVLPAGLGLLSRIGDSPLTGRPIRIRALPGRWRIYTAERNYLVVTRRGEAWSAEWELEDSGRTPPLPI